MENVHQVTEASSGIPQTVRSAPNNLSRWPLSPKSKSDRVVAGSNYHSVATADVRNQLEKSSLYLSCEFLGIAIDSPHLGLAFPTSKVSNIRQECLKMLQVETVTVRALASVIGKLTALILVILPAP